MKLFSSGRKTLTPPSASSPTGAKDETVGANTTSEAAPVTPKPTAAAVASVEDVPKGVLLPPDGAGG